MVVRTTPSAIGVTDATPYGRAVTVEARQDYARVVDGYVLTSAAVEALAAILDGLRQPAGVHAWSITGPYGKGKSAFAVFLCSLLLYSDRALCELAAAKLEDAAPDLYGLLLELRGRERAGEHLVVGPVVAQREPALSTLRRALASAVGAAGPGYTARRELVESNATSPSLAQHSGFIETVKHITNHRPVLLLIDEFGKNLEYAAEHPRSDDLFVLQQLAELLSSGPVSRGGLITLQHMSFADYVANLDSVQRREWAKIQGRFRDVPFLESSSEVVDMICRVLRSRYRVGPDSTGAITRWAGSVVRDYAALQLQTVVELVSDQIAHSYPLHPLALATLPDLVARLGQHNRTLFTFLTSDEPSSLTAFVRAAASGDSAGHLLGLDTLYDYFVADRVFAGGIGDSGGRLAEIANIVAEARSIPAEEMRCLKCIAILNLVSSGGPLRASEPVVAFAMNTGLEIGNQRGASVLRRLMKRGLVTYRGHADEYRVWRGSSFDISGAIEASRVNLDQVALLRLLDRRYPPRPRVASRHSQRTGTLRYFDVRYAHVDDVGSIASSSVTGDGLLVLTAGSHGESRDWPREAVDGRPVVVAWCPDVSTIAEPLSELLAIEGLLERSGETAIDAVAVRELRERSALLHQLVNARVRAAWDPKRTDVLWFAGGRSHEIASDQDVSQLLSMLCDRHYGQGLVLNNEMLNRDVLTSQGAKARRMLMQAMVTSPGEEGLGISGYGPERAMYQSVLAASGIHRECESGWTLGPPNQSSGLMSVWEAVDDFLMRERQRPETLAVLYDALKRPPYGVRNGPIPVLVLAALLHHSEEVAVYEDGTFQVVLTPDSVERLLKAPQRFAVSAVLASPERIEVVRKLQAGLQVASDSRQERNAGLLAVLRVLVSRIHGLPEYARKTRRASECALRVRTAVMQVRDIQELFFSKLPEACLLSLVETKPCGLSPGFADEYARRLRDALDELSQLYPDLLVAIRKQVREMLGGPSAPEGLRDSLRKRALRLVSAGAVGRLLVFANTLAAESFDDRAWIEAVAMAVTGKAPAAWNDDDARGFGHRLWELAREFERFERLARDTDASISIPGFDAYWIGLARPGCDELGRTVWVDRAKAETLGRRVDEFLNTMCSTEDRDTCLALMCRRLLGKPAEVQCRLFDVTTAPESDGLEKP